MAKAVSGSRMIGLVNIAHAAKEERGNLHHEGEADHSPGWFSGRGFFLSM